MRENQGRRRRALATAAAVLLGILALAAGAAAGTFGNTSPGSSSGAPGAGFKFGSVYTLSETATGPMTFFFFATPGEASQTFVPAVYATDGSGNPTNRVAVGTPVAVAPGGGVNTKYQSTLSLTSGSSLPPGNYLLALLAGDTGGQAQIAFGSGSGVFNTQADTTSPSDPFGAFSTSEQQLSFYIEYSSVGSPGAPAPFRGDPARAGYCSAPGDTTMNGDPITPGTFLNLRLGQPNGDQHYLGATPAFYVQGVGLTCDPPSSAFTAAGDTPLVDETGKPGVPGDEGTIYPYFKKTG